MTEFQLDVCESGNDDEVETIPIQDDINFREVKMHSKSQVT
jgi:hypothetical protein